MNTIKNGPEKNAKKSSNKQKWREIEAIRDRHQLLKELQEDDYCWDVDTKELGL